MKKHLLIGLLLLTSGCNLGVPSPTPESTSQATLPSTPTTVPATATLPVTETAVPTPEPPALYFTDEFDTLQPYWEFFQTGGLTRPTPVVGNGILRIDMDIADTWFMGVHNVHIYPNVFVRAQASPSAGGSVGLICRYSESDGWFEFNAESDGSYSVLLGQWLAPEVAKYVPVLTDSNSLLSNNASYTLGLFCQDNFLLLYVNEALIRRVEVTNYGLSEGKVGFTAASQKTVPVSILIEWLRVDSQ